MLTLRPLILTLGSVMAFGLSHQPIENRSKANLSRVDQIASTLSRVDQIPSILIQLCGFVGNLPRGFGNVNEPYFQLSNEVLNSTNGPAVGKIQFVTFFLTRLVLVKSPFLTKLGQDIGLP